MTKHAKLLEAIRTRKGSGEFGYGITTADRYVQNAVNAVGKSMALKYFRCIGSGGVDGLIKRAAETLTITSPETETEKIVRLDKQVTSLADMRRILGAEPPPHSMMAMVNRLTTPREDRDGDTLQTRGARLDPKAPLLWQHIHTAPIGRMVRIVEHNDKLLKVATVLLDINELTSDAGKLFEAGALRFSHGFIAKEFEERKDKSDSGGVPRFNITLFDVVEESAVSVPSNVDAEVELFCRGKLASPAVKAHAKSLFDARNKSMPVTAAAKAAIGGLPKCEACGGRCRKGAKQCDACIQTAQQAIPAGKMPQLSIIRKMFDVATQRLEPSNIEQEFAARFIGCATKDLHVHASGASGMMIGPFLAGLEHATSKYRVTDTRNFDGTGDREKPPVYKTIDVKSDQRKNFLVDGIRFGAGDGSKIAWRTWEGWGSQDLLVYAESGEEAQKVIDDAWAWVAEHNPLKGQAFALAGGWLSKTGIRWEDVFLEKGIEDALKRTVRIINDKGAEAASRGIVLMGPPGTGKTLSARVMLNEAKSTFIWISAKDFWQLGSFGAFAGAFELARSLAPSIICFEDVDNWIDSFTVDLLKGEMDGLQQSCGVTTILTTNFPDQLPAALIDRPGRFHDTLEIHLPSKDVRLRMLQKWASGASLAALAGMADETNGYSGAHLYEMCHFAKVIRDEDECSLDDALTKAFAKVKDQRDLINQNQLAGSSYRPGRRELAAAITKGLVMTHKDMGKCSACDAKGDVDADGYCAECAKEKAEGKGGKGLGLSHGAKAGRVLSRKNREKLEDALGDIDAQHKIMELPRDAKALNRAAHSKVKDVVDASIIQPDEPEPLTTDLVMREAIGNATEDRSFRDKLRKALDALDRADATEQLAADFRQMEQAMSSSG